jgi:hypothetical protein
VSKLVLRRTDAKILIRLQTQEVFYFAVSMNKIKTLSLVAVLAMVIGASNPLRAEPTLGDAPRAPADVSGLPGGGPHPNSVTGGFSVDTTSREQVRSFYNAVFNSSSGTPINSTADQSSCFPGTNSPAFAEVTLRRINWFRAMAGLSAAVTFDSGESAKDQQAAVIMSSNNKLQHTGVWTNWTCITSDGTNAAGNSNLALGIDGPDAITGYIWDYGTNNFEVGHRRNLLYPQTQIMATGDVPQENTLAPANATWVFDANYFSQRPATRNPYVAWPPPGYVPYQVVYPQWSFALSNADLSAATVSLQSNGVPVAVTIQPYVTGYGEDTLVWYPTSLDPTTANTIFPFSGTDTVYTVTLGNVVTASGTKSFNYNVTAFDPSVPGADYFPPTISGTAQPAVNAANPYACTAITNATSYQWVTAQTPSGNLFDGAENGLVNFNASVSPGYPVITNFPTPPSGSSLFNLAHPGGTNDQILQFKQVFFPATNTQMTFKSELGYAYTDEIAKVQASTDGGLTWQDIYTQPGTNLLVQNETSFSTHTLSFSNYAGKPTLLQFNYHINIDPSSGIYSNIPPQSGFVIGWYLDNIVVTNTSQLVSFVTNSTVSTNFTFTPTVATNYVIQASAVIFNQFPLNGGPFKQVTAIAAPPVITLNTPFVSGNQVQLNFSVSGTASTFKLLQEDQLNGTWITNSSATFTTNVPGSSYRFTATGGTATRFYRIQSP